MAGEQEGSAAAGRTAWPRSVMLAVGAALAGGAAAFLVHPALGLALSPAQVGMLAAVLILALALFGFALLRKRGAEPVLEALADASGSADVVADEKGIPIHCNSAFLALASKAGFSRLVGMDVLFAGYPEFSEAVYQLAQAARAGKALGRDVRVAANSSVPGAAADGPRWLHLSVAPLSAQGKAYARWRLQDISQDRQSQETAFNRLQYIITYLDNAPAGFFSTLADGKIDYVNATLAGWLGRDLAEVQGGRMTQTQLVGEDASRLLSASKPVPGGSANHRFAVQLEGPQGNRIDVDLIHRADFDGDGRALPTRTLVVQRQTVAADAGGGTSFFQRISGAAPLGLARLTPSGEIISANAKFLGLSARLKLLGTVQEVLRGNDLPGFETALAKSKVAGASPESVDILLDETPPRAVQLTLAPEAGGEILAFAVDKTESKALEMQLAQSQKMQAVGQLASGIAHDFNNVLTPIIGFADLLLAKMRPTDSAFADIMNIKQNANRAANLVRQLLAFSRKQTMQPKVNLLSESMSDLGNLLGRVLGEKIALDIAHGRDLGHVMVDFNQFEQVIINLAVNARDAMPSGGRLAVRTYNVTAGPQLPEKHKLPPGDYVVCEVSDTGTGIAPEILEKIWEPFFSTKEVGKGTGLGLSMVYGIVKQTGGFIYCDSVLGKGTTFTIYLPRHYPEVKAVEAPVAKPEATQADHTGRGRILVVEDEDSVRAFAVRALASRGYTVVEADSGETGLEAIENDKDGFEVILSDVVMPEMDGPTMLAEIRKRGITSKFIFMSGYAEDAFERNLENPDDFAFIQKPFTLKQLVEKVKEVMG